MPPPKKLIPLVHFFIFLLIPVASSSFSIAKPGCPERCADLTIPYPFGVESNCSLGPSFDITCNTSTNPPKPYLSIFKNPMQLIEIKPSQIRVTLPDLLTVACYYHFGGPPRVGLGPNRTAEDNSDFDGFSLVGSQYTWSEENWLTALGCDDLVLGRGEGDQVFGGGCVSYCAAAKDSGGLGFCPDNDYGYPAGNGCCRTTVPKDITKLQAQSTNLGEKLHEAKLFNCSYAFIQGKLISNQSKFSYPLSYLNSRTEFVDDNYRWIRGAPPVVRLDWRIGTENCSQARQNAKSYACHENNTNCVDLNGGVGGYQCYCMSGYDGNPYLTPGCQDIDECANSTNNPCDSNAFCVNTSGSFNCSCKRGYYGDGRSLNGTGCSRLPSKYISISIGAIAHTGVSSGIGFILLLLTCIWLYKLIQKRKENSRKERFFKQNGGLILQQKTTEGSIRNAKHFPAKELEKATDNFNESRILGQGGQGIVYKGILSDGKTVAIKKSKHVHAKQLEEFINEVVILLQVDHRNVVKLLGCCLETEVPLLVYEFVPNGTLFNLIHDPNTEFPFLWNMRLKIAADIAGALAHLHSASSIPIYHRDIKSTNILLDEKYIVKVSDFGTSKSVEVDKTHFTTKVRGTFGYLDPEYFRSGQFTDKSDVYSFGVILLELLTRKKPISSDKTQDEKSLATWFLALMEENNLDLILDPLVKEQGLREEVMAIARLAQRCLNSMGKMRPTMKEVATKLASYNISQMSSTVEDERVYEAKAMMISDTEYTWTFSGKSEFSSSSDTNPFMSETQIV